MPPLPEEHQPLFLRIARGVMDDVKQGRLRPGQRLRGSREWAKALGVARNTVLAALAELEAQGWLTTSPARGTFVSEALPMELSGPPSRGLAPLGLGLPAEPNLATDRLFRLQPETLHFSAGTPDPRLVPVELIARTWRRVLRRGGHRLLEYGEPAGHPGLRRALAEMLTDVRGVAASPGQIVVTRGSQMALDLVARAVIRPGEVVAVEALGYRPAWDALRLAGARLWPLAVDHEGLNVDALERVLARRKVRAIYVTPHHQYPTTVTMSAARRLRFLALARRHQMLVLEDDYDHEFHYEGRPVRPLASADDAGVVASIGTLSKVLAPGLRLGFVVAPTALAERLVQLRAVMDRQGDHPMEATVAELLEEGELQRHIRKMRSVYRARRDFLVRQLERRLGAVLDWTVPPGGISVWAKVKGPLDVQRWLQRALHRGVAVQPGQRYTFDGHEPGALRLVFARFTEGELARAVEVLASTVPSRSLSGKTLGRATSSSAPTLARR